MINGEKYVNGSWTTAEIPTRKLHNKTDIITSLPVDIYTDGQSASANIIGNMSQSGTPTPTSPITPSECGERTANLFDKRQVIDNMSYDSQGQLAPPTDPYRHYAASGYIAVESEETYIRSDNGVAVGNIINFYDSSKVFVSQYQAGMGRPITIPSGVSYVTFTVAITGGTTIDNFQFEKGSTPTPYQPYGYKLDIKTGSTTTPVYLGQVQSTRKIKKYEFTGNESWYDLSETGIYYTTNSAALNPIYSLGISDRFVYHFVNLVRDLAHGEYLIDMTNKYTWFRSNDIASLQDWKTYLQQQYANGTPVTVWYVLATETTGIVNEPIRKIGSYSDSVSVANIPTTSGGIEFDVDTTLKPSEVDLTYHGWHDISPLQRVNGEWV